MRNVIVDITEDVGKFGLGRQDQSQWNDVPVVGRRQRAIGDRRNRQCHQHSNYAHAIHFCDADRADERYNHLPQSGRGSWLYFVN